MIRQAFGIAAAAIIAGASAGSVGGTGAGAGVTSYRGAIARGTGVFHSPALTNDPCTATSMMDQDAAGLDFYYNAQSIMVAQGGLYTISNVRNAFDDQQDSVLLLYQNSFDPSQPLKNLVAINDDRSDTVYTAQLTCELVARVLYVIVTTSYTHAKSGSFENSVSGAGIVSLIRQARQGSSVWRPQQWYMFPY